MEVPWDLKEVHFYYYKKWKTHFSIISTIKATSKKKQPRILMSIFLHYTYSISCTNRMHCKCTHFLRARNYLLMPEVHTFGGTKIYAYSKVKCIFHQNVNCLVLGAHIGHDRRCEHFGLSIPTYWYLKHLTNPTPTSTNPT